MKRSVMMALAAAVTAALFFVAGSRPGAASGATTAGNKGSAAKALEATAKLESRSGSTVTGEAEFTEKNGGVEVSIQIKGAKPGTHGVHLHDKGDCSAPDASSAAGHFNPDSKNHGAPNVDPHHAVAKAPTSQVGARGVQLARRVTRRPNALGTVLAPR